MATIVGAYTGGSLTAADILAGRGHKLGYRYTDHNGNEFVFVKASAAIGQYDAVIYDETYGNGGTCAPLSTSNDAVGDKVGSAQAAMASGEYGWLQVMGVGLINAIASTAANVKLGSSATAGYLDDVVSAGFATVEGLYLTTARGGTNGSAAAVFNDPFIPSIA